MKLKGIRKKINSGRTFRTQSKYDNESCIDRCETDRALNKGYFQQDSEHVAMEISSAKRDEDFSLVGEGKSTQF